MGSRTKFDPEGFDKGWEFLSREERESRTLGRLKDILRYAAERSPFYSALYKRHRFIPSDVKDPAGFYENAPFINKTVLMDEQAKDPPCGSLLTVPVNDLARLYYSPGPLLIVFSHEDLAAYVERAARGLFHAGARASDVVNITFNYNWVGAGTQHDDAYRLIGCAVLPGGAGMSETHIELMKLTKTTVVSAFPTYAMHLSETAVRMGIDPKNDLSVRLIIIVGEIRKEEDKQDLAEAFGAEIREMYVGNEMGFVGSECDHGGGMHLYSDTIVEVIDPETGKHVDEGQPGEIVTTDLHRKAMPIIHYRTGDITEGITYEKCPCGRSTPKMKRILGRVGDIPRVKGMFIPPRRIELVLNDYDRLQKYQLVIDRPEKKDRITIRIECPPGMQEEGLKRLLVEKLRIALGITPEIEFVLPETISEGEPGILDKRTAG